MKLKLFLARSLLIFQFLHVAYRFKKAKSNRKINKYVCYGKIMSSPIFVINNWCWLGIFYILPILFIIFVFVLSQLQCKLSVTLTKFPSTWSWTICALDVVSFTIIICVQKSPWITFWVYQLNHDYGYSNETIDIKSTGAYTKINVLFETRGSRWHHHIHHHVHP